MGPPISLAAAPIRFLFYFLLLLALIVPVLIIGLAFKLPISRDTGNPVVICSQCHRTKLRDAASGCDCGGCFEDFNRWKWVKDKRDEIGPS